MLEMIPVEIFQTLGALAGFVGFGTGVAALWIVLGDRRRAWRRRIIVSRVLAPSPRRQRWEDIASGNLSGNQ